MSTFVKTFTHLPYSIDHSKKKQPKQKTKDTFIEKNNLLLFVFGTNSLKKVFTDCNIANLLCRQVRNLNYSLCFSDFLKRLQS